MTKSLLLLLALCVTIGSFIDEASLVAAALAVNHSNDSHLALLYMASMLGAMAGSRLCAYLLAHLSEAVIVKWLFFVQALMVLLIYIASGVGVALMGFGLGLIGSILWTAIMSVVPLYCPKAYLDTANKALQTISNLGAVAGPALVGVIYDRLGKIALVYLAVASVMAGVGVLFYQYAKQFHTPAKHRADNQSNCQTSNQSSKEYHSPTNRHKPNYKPIDHPTQSNTHLSTLNAITVLFSYRAIKHALMPLSVIIVFTSTLNVLLVPYINSVLTLGSTMYGITLTMMSLGLLLSPFLLSGFFAQFGRVRGAMLGASVMGVAMMLLGIPTLGTYDSLRVLLAGLLIGMGNGIINTLMGAFMMHTLGDNSKRLMPYYILCLQSSVLMGFGLAYFVDKALMAEFLLGAGALVVVIALLGAVYNPSSNRLNTPPNASD